MKSRDYNTPDGTLKKNFPGTYNLLSSHPRRQWSPDDADPQGEVRGDDGGGHDGYGNAIDNGDGDGNDGFGGDGYGLNFAAHLLLGDGGEGCAPPSAMTMRRY
ncbi:unnamed protein product [Urochloa humidicola]